MHSNAKTTTDTVRLSKYFGPSTLVAAAFIGPGTVTTCTMAGVKSGYGLLWAMVFSIVATLILQEMSARLGWVTRKGLGEAINSTFTSGLSRIIVFFIIIGAILIGNAAYEAGNLSGGILGLELLFQPARYWPIVIGGLAFSLLLLGNYKFIEKVLVTLVITMSVCFLLTAVLVQPDLTAILKGFVPDFKDMDVLLILGLIGTTVVPYNLFLHASTVSKKWPAESDIADIRMENRVSIIMGGLISMLIIITAAATRGQADAVGNAADLAKQLEPLFGSAAPILMGIGLLAAGLSSGLTAPLAAAWAAKGLFGWKEDEKGIKFRAVWMTILVIGIIVTLTGANMILIIKFAQITNAILLPCIAGFLLYLVNQQKIMEVYSNGLLQNILAGIIILITIFLSLNSFNKLFGFF